MDPTLLVLFAAAGLLIVPLLGADDEDDKSGSEEIHGTLEDDDPLEGTDASDNIFAFAGNDTVNGNGGNDFINAGLGNDTVNGGDGRDTIEGRAGDDVLNGGNGSDTISGGLGNDQIDGGRQVDFIRGGQGDDIILGGAPAELDEDDNLVVDSSRGDVARGEGGNDSVFIWGGRGEAHGGEGEDTLVLVSGQGKLIDDFEDDNKTDYFVLGNAQDGGILTRGVVTDFDPAIDTLTLTVDGELDGSTPDVEFTLTERTIVWGDETFSGVFVKADIVDGEPEVEGSEGAGVLLSGLSIDDLDGALIDVVFTESANYFDPQATIAET